MKTLNLSFFLSVVSTLLISGCDDTSPVAITDSAIYSEFSVVYSAVTNSTAAKAIFWKENKNNVQVIFNPDAVLTFQNIALEYQQQGAFYSKKLLGFTAEYTFKIVDINKKTFTNTLSANTIAFPVANDTLNLAQTFKLDWFGSPLEKNEYVILRIGGINFQQDTLGKQSIYFTASERFSLNSFKNQTVDASFERYKIVSPLQQSLGGGGIISAQFSSVNKNFYIK